MSNLVLYNGTFYTLDPAKPIVSALAIRDGKILYAGDDATVREFAGKGCESVDVKGACGVPGMVDAHTHYSFYAMALQNADAEVPTLQQALNNISALAAKTPEGQWVRGYGFNHNVWGDASFPTAAQLDGAVPNHPVVVESKSGHLLWLNSLALAKCGITAATPDPEGGEIVRDAAGNPTGTLLENAMELAYAVRPEPTHEELQQALLGAQDAYAATGLTGVHDMDRVAAWRAQQALDLQDKLSIRVWKAIALEQIDEAVGVGIMSGMGNDMLRISGIKMFTDGAMGPRTAWMLEGYETDPGFCGIPTNTVEVLREGVIKANTHGLAAVIHAIGDRANREILDIFAEANQMGISKGLHNRIEHCQILHPDDVARFAELGVVASVQPIHATSDMYISDKHLGARAKGSYAFKWLADAGAVLAFGSDCPVEVPNPLLGIHAAVTRRRFDGTPGPDGWNPEQRLTVEQAVRAYSYGSAYAVGQEDVLGSLSVGKLGDVSLFSEDIFQIDPHAIKDVSVAGTVVGGKFAYRSDSI